VALVEFLVDYEAFSRVSHGSLVTGVAGWNLKIRFTHPAETALSVLAVKTDIGEIPRRDVTVPKSTFWQRLNCSLARPIGNISTTVGCYDFRYDPKENATLNLALAASALISKTFDGKTSSPLTAATDCFRNMVFNDDGASRGGRA